MLGGASPGPALAMAAGLNACIPLVVLGLADGFIDTYALPSAWAWSSNDWALRTWVSCSLVELVADAIPAVDSVNDVIVQTRAASSTAGGSRLRRGEPTAEHDRRGQRPRPRCRAVRAVGADPRRRRPSARRRTRRHQGVWIPIRRAASRTGGLGEHLAIGDRSDRGRACGWPCRPAVGRGRPRCCWPARSSAASCWGCAARPRADSQLVHRRRALDRRAPDPRLRRKALPAAAGREDVVRGVRALVALSAARPARTPRRSVGRREVYARNKAGPRGGPAFRISGSRLGVARELLAQSGERLVVGEGAARRLLSRRERARRRGGRRSEQRPRPRGPWRRLPCAPPSEPGQRRTPAPTSRAGSSKPSSHSLVSGSKPSGYL